MFLLLRRSSRPAEDLEQRTDDGWRHESLPAVPGVACRILCGSSSAFCCCDDCRSAAPCRSVRQSWHSRWPESMARSSDSGTEWPQHPQDAICVNSVLMLFNWTSSFARSAVSASALTSALSITSCNALIFSRKCCLNRCIRTASSALATALASARTASCQSVKAISSASCRSVVARLDPSGFSARLRGDFSPGNCTFHHQRACLQ